MKIDRKKLDVTLANQCKSVTDLRDQLSAASITRIRAGSEVGTRTAGKLARALGVDVTELILEDD